MGRARVAGVHCVEAVLEWAGLDKVYVQELLFHAWMAGIYGNHQAYEGVTGMGVPCSWLTLIVIVQEIAVNVFAIAE